MQTNEGKSERKRRVLVLVLVFVPAERKFAASLPGSPGNCSEF